MKINDVEKITGLTQKAIRLYESKGLISVSRDINGYRNYSSDNVERLKSIKLFRSVGISICDIKLYLFGVMSIEELMDKRKSEILKESGKNSEKYRLCESILKNDSSEELKITEYFTESEKPSTRSYGTLCAGIDLGTTTISASVYDIDAMEQVESYSLPHNSYLSRGKICEQNPSLIVEKAERLLYHILNSYDGIVSIGITGQMHGIVYIDGEGNAVSSLINWQDKRGDEVLKDGKNVCDTVFDITRQSVSSGYGIATHYYNMLKGNVPSGAVSFCSIMDYFAMKICNLKKPTIHTSVGASFGLFDVKEGCFMYEKLSLLGIKEDFLPQVTKESLVIGKVNGIPVSVAIGDNQASFLGSVGSGKESVLVNIGTGSQVSTVVEDYAQLSRDVELRPFVQGTYLVCGSALCGGFAYSMLESFFRSYAVSLGMEESSQYRVMNQLAKEEYGLIKSGLSKKSELLVDTSFCGKRSQPNARGSVKMIDRESFTPSALILGVLKGMCTELYELYCQFPNRKSHIVASGGAVRQVEILKNLLSDVFGMPVSAKSEEEEASSGAALFSALATGKLKYESIIFKH